jgi:hypothetical protein
VSLQLNGALTGRGVVLGIELVDATGRNLSSAAIAVTALNIAPSNQPWDGQRPNYDVPFLYEPRLTRSGAGYLLLVNSRRLTPGNYTLTFRAGVDPTAHTLAFRVR